MKDYQWFDEVDAVTLKDWVDKYLQGDSKVDYYKLVYPRLDLVRADIIAALKRTDAFNWITDPGGDRCLATREWGQSLDVSIFYNRVSFINHKIN